jgi:hypothetical protein
LGFTLRRGTRIRSSNRSNTRREQQEEETTHSQPTKPNSTTIPRPHSRRSLGSKIPLRYRQRNPADSGGDPLNHQRKIGRPKTREQRRPKTREQQEIAKIKWQIEACVSAIEKSKMTIETLQYKLHQSGEGGEESAVAVAAETNAAAEVADHGYNGYNNNIRSGDSTRLRLGEEERRTRILPMLNTQVKELRKTCLDALGEDRFTGLYETLKRNDNNDNDHGGDGVGGNNVNGRPAPSSASFPFLPLVEQIIHMERQLG